MGDIIREAGCGFQVDHGNVEKLKDIIGQAMKLSEKEKDAIRAKTQALVCQKYSKNLITKQFISDFLI